MTQTPFTVAAGADLDMAKGQSKGRTGRRSAKWMAGASALGNEKGRHQAMRNRILAAGAVFAAALALSAQSSWANPTVVLNGPLVATAVDNLVVNGTIYDVTFGHQSVTSPPISTTFQGNASGALVAANALVSALNGSTATYVDVTGLGSFISFEVQDNGLYGMSGASSGTAGSWSSLANYADPSVALFSPAAVPEPASLALFGTALVGLGLIRRRRAPAARGA